MTDAILTDLKNIISATVSQQLAEYRIQQRADIHDEVAATTAPLRKELEFVRNQVGSLRKDVDSLRQDFESVNTDVKSLLREFKTVHKELKSDIKKAAQKLDAKIDSLGSFTFEVVDSYHKAHEKRLAKLEARIA